MIRNTVVLHKASWIEAGMFPPFPAMQVQQSLEQEQFNTHSQQNIMQTEPVVASVESQFSPEPFRIEPLWLVEKRYIEKAISACKDNVPKAAALLDISPSTIYRKMKTWEQMNEEIT